MRAASAGPLLAGLLLVAGLGAAAISWTSDAEVALDVAGAPAFLAGGAGAARDRYVDSFALTPNLTGFSATLHPRFGATMNVKDVFRVQSNSSSTTDVSLSGNAVTNVQVLVYAWTVKDGSTTVATLDMKTGSPSVTFSLPAGASRKVDLRIQTADGSGSNNADLSTAIRLGVP